MRIINILALATFLFVSCSTKQENRTIEPYKIGSVSEDSTIITFSYADFLKRDALADRYNRIVLDKRYDENARYNTSNTLFINMLNELKLMHETNYLGITVTDAELSDLIQGRYVHPSIKTMPLFSNPETKEFDVTRLINFVNRLKREKSSDPYFTWQYHLEEMKRAVLKEKYESLLSASYLQTNMEDAWYKKLVQGVSTIEIGFLPYRHFRDSIEPTKEEIMNAVLEKAYNYQTHEKRYLRIANVPINIYKHFHEKEFTTFERYLSTVTDFNEIAKQNKTIKSFSSYYTKGAIPEHLIAFFKNGKVGDTFGPFYEKNSYRAIKIDNVNPAPEQVKARHLVIKGVSEDEINKLKAQIVAAVQQGADFLELAKEYIKPYGFDGKWGDLEWFRYAEMVKSFSDAAFFNPAGSYVTAKSEYGWHIIEIQEHRNVTPKYNFTSLYWPLSPSNEDVEASMKEAEEFSTSIDDVAEFAEKAVERRYILQEDVATAFGSNLQNMANTRDVVEWAFHNPEGSVSKPYFIDGSIYVFQIEEVNKPGLMAYREVSEYMSGDVKTELAKKVMRDKFEFDKMNTLSFEESAKQIGMDIHTVSGIAFHQDAIANVGSDTYFIGLACAANPGDVSKLFFGTKGLMQFKKISEKPDVLSKQYASLRAKDWQIQIDNAGYAQVFKLHDNMMINKIREQDSYFLVPTYTDNLSFDEKAAQEMFYAEHAFRTEDYQLALNGDGSFLGFSQLVVELNPSKQKRLAALYAGLSAFKLGDYKQAITYMDTLNMDDRFFSVISKGVQGDAYLQLGDVDNAVKLYKEAITSNDNFFTNGVYLMKLAAIADYRADYQEAYGYLMQIEDKYPQSHVKMNLQRFLATYKYLGHKDSIIR